MNRRWTHLAGIALVLTCTAFFVRQLVTLLSTGGVDLSQSLPLFPMAVAAYMLAYLVFGLAWHQLLAASGNSRPYSIALGIFTTSQFAKYLPGNVGHHVGRVVIGTKYGQLPAHTVIATLIVELAMVLTAMALLSLPSSGYWLGRLDIDLKPLIITATATIAAGMTVLALGARFRHHVLIQRVSQAFRQLMKDRVGSSFHLLWAFTAISVGVSLTALSLGLLDKSFGFLSLSQFPALLAIFAASWLIGFLVPGAPAGIGIREIVLTEGLAPLIGRDKSILVALLFRILSTACDLLAFILGSAILGLHRDRNRGPGP